MSPETRCAMCPRRPRTFARSISSTLPPPLPPPHLHQVLLSATSRYQSMAVDAIAAELQRDYANLGGESSPAAQTMERGRTGRNGRGRRAPLLEQ